MIRWITENLGTAAYASIPVGIDAAVIDVRDLVDKPGNDVGLIREKIDYALVERRRGRRVVICCDYGISRSNAVAAGVLSCEHGISLSEATRRTIEATGEKDIKVDMLGAVRQALGEDGGRARTVARQRILLTGGNGFIGQRLGGTLAEVATVLTPGRREVDLLNDPVGLDLYVNQYCIDRVVHLANPRIYTSNQAMGQIVVMMRNVLDVCRNNDLKLFYLSSWEVFSGYHSQGLLADESLPMRAKGPYGEAKLLAELMIEQFQRNFGLHYCTIRSGPVLGRGGDRPKFIHTFWEKARRGEDIHTHRYLNGLPALDMIALNDLMTAIRMLIGSNAEGVFHVGMGRAISTFEIAQMLVDMAGSSSQIRCRDVEEYTANIIMNTRKMASQFDWKVNVDIRASLEALLASDIHQTEETKRDRIDG